MFYNCTLKAGCSKKMVILQSLICVWRSIIQAVILILPLTLREELTLNKHVLMYLTVHACSMSVIH